MTGASPPARIHSALNALAKRFCSGESLAMTATVIAPPSRARRASCRASPSIVSVSVYIVSGSVIVLVELVEGEGRREIESGAGDSLDVVADERPDDDARPGAYRLRKRVEHVAVAVRDHQGLRVGGAGGGEEAGLHRFRRAAERRRPERQHEGDHRRLDARLRRSPEGFAASGSPSLAAGDCAADNACSPSDSAHRIAARHHRAPMGEFRSGRYRAIIRSES